MIDKHGEPVRENYRRQGEVRERERILAAIEKLRPCIDENGTQWFAQFKTIIAVIKGESNG
jgi:hypothetical protein